MKDTNIQKISQEQLYDLLVSRELNWRDIINDLIKTEQLNPWNIDLGILAKKYVERIRLLEELSEGTFFISSKVLLAAALLLRIKSELLHNNILSIDEILFDKKKKDVERVQPKKETQVSKPKPVEKKPAEVKKEPTPVEKVVEEKKVKPVKPKKATKAKKKTN